MDGRKAGPPLSEGISPGQGADRRAPTAVFKSPAKMDHNKTGGTLLNLKFAPSRVATEDGLDKWAHLVRGDFKRDGHHVQFNVTTADTLRKAQAAPQQHRTSSSVWQATATTSATCRRNCRRRSSRGPSTEVSEEDSRPTARFVDTASRRR